MLLGGVIGDCGGNCPGWGEDADARTHRSCGGHGGRGRKPPEGEHAAEGGRSEPAAEHAVRGEDKGTAKSETKTYDPKKQYEIKLIEIKAPNKASGRTFLYDLQIVVLVKGKAAKELEKTISERDALIRDRIRTIIAQSDPRKARWRVESRVWKRFVQVKYQLNEIVGEGKVDEVLVPRCIPYRTDY